jgi:hypothetical protein
MLRACPLMLRACPFMLRDRPFRLERAGDDGSSDDVHAGRAGAVVVDREGLRHVALVRGQREAGVDDVQVRVEDG